MGEMGIVVLRVNKDVTRIAAAAAAAAGLVVGVEK